MLSLAKQYFSIATVVVIWLMLSSTLPAASFKGQFFSGEGDTAYIKLLDIARRMFAPDYEFQNVAMLYTPWWNGFVEGPTWDAWWIQNSYGPSYCALPFYEEPYVTFLQNAQDLWFDQMGDGQRVGAKDWVAPDGCLCDAARPGWIMYKQGDGRIDIHDWGMEFTAAGLLLQAELLLISRDIQAIAYYLPKLERCANFIETRRNSENNLFLAGPAGNLLAPSYAGWHRADGSYDMAYLSGLSITYIAALDRLIELEKLAGQNKKAQLYQDRRDLARNGLSHIVTDEGYFIKSLDPDGTRHGVYGSEKHGYFEASPNHDAIAFRVVDDKQARRIYKKIESIPGLRRHNVIIANHPGLDDMYDSGTSWLWQHGTWVNGGHWSTCEARMILAYFRLGQYKDARRSMEHMLTFARQFRMDNPLVEFGSKVYQPKEPINLCYDSFGPPAAMVRGLFEYIYTASTLRLVPHIPPGITRLEQHFPIRFGTKRLYIATKGQGPVTAVKINGQNYGNFNGQDVILSYKHTPQQAYIQILLGKATFDDSDQKINNIWLQKEPVVPVEFKLSPKYSSAKDLYERVKLFYNRLLSEGFGDCYEAHHANLIFQAAEAWQKRHDLLTKRALKSLSEPAHTAANEAYLDTIKKLSEGLEKTLESYSDSPDSKKQTFYKLWIESDIREGR
jgi:hypothetical protein